MSRVVDLDAVRASLKRLDELAKNHPEAWERAPTTVAGWEQTLTEDEAMKTQQVAFRLEEDLLARVDAHAEKMAAMMPGVNVTRADAVRALLTQALSAAQAPAEKKKARR